MQKFKSLILNTGLLISLAGCQTQQIQITPLVNQFNVSEAQYINVSGNNSIHAQAFLRTNGGSVVTCAGYEVQLIPATKYAGERLSHIYGSGNYANTHRISSVKFQNTESDYLKYRKVTTCDAQGSFSFEGLADGNYYVIALVLWKVGNANQGGGLMHDFFVKGGEKINLVLTDKQ